VRSATFANVETALLEPTTVFVMFFVMFFVLVF
jgi:hypothetical protein